MRIRLLGPVDVMVDGEARLVSGLAADAGYATHACGCWKRSAAGTGAR